MIKRSQTRWLALSLLFSTVVLILVLYFTIDENTFGYISRLNPYMLLAALLLHAFAQCIWSFRIQKMTEWLGYRVGFRHCLTLVLANLFVAAITPSQAGGEPVRIHQLYRAGVPVGDATAVVIIERVFDAIVLTFLGILVISGLGSIVSGSSDFALIAVIGAIAGVAVLVFLIVYSVTNPSFIKRLLKRISSLFVLRWRPDRLERFFSRIDCEVDNFNESIRKFLKKGKGGSLTAIALTVLFWAVEFITASAILVGLAQPPFLLESFTAQIVIAIIMMVPLTPGSSGIAEVTATSIYRIFVNPSIVGIFVVIWRFIFFYFNILIGFLAGLSILKKEAVLNIDR